MAFSTLHEGHKFAFHCLLLVSGCGGRLLCLARANLKIQLFACQRKNQGLTTSVASVQQQQVCSRAIGSPPQGMSAAVFESTSSRVVCRSIWHNTWYAMCGFELKMGICSVIRFPSSIQRHFNSHAEIQGSARTRSLVFAGCSCDGVVPGLLMHMVGFTEHRQRVPSDKKEIRSAQR